MLVISLYNGIKIDNISFKNINIQGLYLKYDKKLIIDTRNIAISYQGDTKTIDMKVKFSIENFFDNYFINIDEYVLFDPYLKASGKFVLDLKHISLDNISNLTINDFALQFNKNLKFLTAKSCLVTFKNNNFYFQFTKPTYDGVSLQGSKAEILDLDRLKLELTSQDKLKKPLLELLSNYKINLPLTQKYGKNSIFTKLIIPFDIKQEIQIQSKITLENSKIFLYNIPLYTQKFNLLLKDNSLQGSGTLKKEDENNSSLRYNIDTLFNIDFSRNRVKGNFNAKSVSFKDISIKDMDGIFDSNFTKKFISNIFLKQGVITLKNEKFLCKNSKITYKDNNKSFYSHLKLKSFKYPFTIDLSDKFNLSSLDSTGDVHFNYKSNDIDILSHKMTYKTHFNNGVKINVDFNEIIGKIFKKNILLKDGKIQYKDGKIDGHINSVQSNSEFIQFSFNDATLNYNIHDKKIMNIKSNNIKLLINHFDIGVKKSTLQMDQNTLNINSFISNKYINTTITTNIDLIKKTVNGNILLPKFEKKKYNDFKFDINYKDDILFNIPALGFEMKKNESNSTLIINNFHPLQDYFDFLKIDSKSKLFLTRDTNANTNIHLEHISIILDAFYNALRKDQEKQNFTDKINLYWKNSFVKYNNFKFYFNHLNGQIRNNNLHLKLQKNATELTIVKINNNTIVKSKKIDANYINAIVGKKVLKGGYADIFLTGGLNKYHGKIKLYNTTIVKMQLVNNLLLFLNSTPVLINPLLAIPTIYRLTQNNFELNGYYIDKGLLKFNYNHIDRYLDIYNIITKGKINDFEGDIKLSFIDNIINGNLRVSTLKDYAKIVNNIPIINYLFLDTKGRFSIPISIYGTIDNPKYKIPNNK